VAAVAGAAALASASGSPAVLTSGYSYADRLVVDKSERRLRLVKAGQVIAEYPIRLGLNPGGHKLHEGDFRTPEGHYYLSRRNPRSDYFLSIEVSYPNEADRRRARGHGKQPGGSIMIHGLPNVPRKPADYYERNDWTDGCIAVSNSDMVDIWLRTTVGVPIDIQP
jgi:murein L,D-transpeptidase YafK